MNTLDEFAGKIAAEQAAEERFCMEAWLAVANSNSSTETSVPTYWADQALKDFKKRFRKEKAT